MAGNILIIDDEPLVSRTFSRLLKDAGFTATTASGGREALSLLLKEPHDVILLDLRMPEINGIALLKKIRNAGYDQPVIMITAYGEVPDAVEAMKLGAYDFLLKPPDFDYLLAAINRAMEKARLNNEIKQLDRSLESSLEMLLGRSSAIAKVIGNIRAVAASDFSVIIEGETGTGKTFIANIIHNLSRRAKQPMVALDIGAIPETLIESELFGYEQGAFTGADKKKTGYLQIADKGTLFIDELQNLAPQGQSKLLKVVEEKRFYPLGRNSPVEADIRIISATNTSMAQAVSDKRFRRDLYYRLNEFTIKLPPLRERHGDIAFLAQMFLTEVSAELKKCIPSIHDDAMEFLMKQPWHGNVREMKNVMRRAALLCDKNIITMEVLHQDQDRVETLKRAGLPDIKASAPQGSRDVMSIREAEEIAIRRALEHTGGNKTKAAQILGITLKTLLQKIKMYSN